jgi:Zn-dependent peptidase ImmA (M78 family)/transcriptional regulator with XRE-family HTH domain
MLTVSQGTIAMIEKGARQPSDELLSKIVIATGFPAEFFTDESDFEVPLGSLLYRKYSSLTSMEKARCHRIAQECFGLASKMAPRLKSYPVKLPMIKDHTPEEMAQLARSAIGCDATSPVRNLIRRLEKCGVWIFALPEDVDKMDAFSTWVDDRPVIVLSDGRPGDRQRWNVAHELGHLVLHQLFRGSSGDIETEANVFAAELLTPRSAMEDELTAPVTISGLAELKARWHVAIRSLMRRAKEIGTITDRQYRYLNVQAMKMWGTSKSEPVSIPIEKPRALRKMAEVLYGDPINFKRLSSDARLPVFWVKRIIEAHEGSTTSIGSPGKIAPFNR